jgi:hypothetical protein
LTGGGKDRRPKGTSMKRRRPLITPPLYWQMSTTPVPHPVMPVLAERGGTQLKTPRPEDLSDLVRSLTAERTVFINRLRLMAQCPHRWLVITDTVSQVKSPYPRTSVSPNQITQSLIAVLAGLQVPFLCTETHGLGEELVASYLYQVYLYHWLETNDYGRFLSDQDL